MAFGNDRHGTARGGGTRAGGAVRVRDERDRGGTVSQYNVGAGGLLAPLSPPTVVAGERPSEIAVSPNGSSVYVVNSTSDSVSQYDVGPGGKLSPKSPPTVAAGTNPSGVAVSPNGNGVYVTNAGTTGGFAVRRRPGRALVAEEPRDGGRRL